MVTEGNLEKAISFIFGGCEDEYAGFIAKVREYHDTVQATHIDTVLEMMDKGVRYNIFAKYNFPEMPLYAGAAIQSDGDTPILWPLIWGAGCLQVMMNSRRGSPEGTWCWFSSALFTRWGVGED